ncbi:zinc metalloprotease [Kribbella sp. NPDC026596]|uniref:zinc metalloprotease n=1 Tax=Kribbella sp. NPDC026596 TaxID=3155122 RepID=UPI0033F5BAD3
MRWSRIAGIAGVAVLVSAGLTGAQSQAAPPGPDRVGPCVPEDSVVQARGGREPDLGQVAQDLPAAAKGKAKPGFRATVPVYFHVVTDGSIGSLTTAQIRAQIGVLNNTYAGGEGGARTGFSFALAGVTRTDNATWFYAGAGGEPEHSMKRALHTGGPGDLNLYSTTAGEGLLGWAYLPDIVTKPGQAYLDGVVIDWESMLGTSTRYAGAFDQGETATHEVGHWLNLEHTFFGGCSAKGDFVSDTPAEKTPTSGCPAGKDTCTAPGLDPIHNYMDYSFDSCYTQFTPGQAQRMGDAWLFYRAG